MDTVPTERLLITEPANAVAEIKEFAAQLETKGQRPWFEVWYPHTTEADFDAVEVTDGDINTLLPYAMLRAAS